MKKIITFHTENNNPARAEFWKSKSPEERVMAVETIREHYYSMLGCTDPPRIKKIIRIT